MRRDKDDEKRRGGRGGSRGDREGERGCTEELRGFPRRFAVAIVTNRMTT